MRDVALILSKNFFDIEINGQDLTADDGLENALAMSLFTDRRVSDEQLPQGVTNKKGWWGDMYAENPGDQIGSRLWTINPAKITDETRKLAEDYCVESTEWLIGDGIADTINFTIEYNESKHLNILIEVIRPDKTSSKYQVVWDSQKIRRL